MIQRSHIWLCFIVMSMNDCIHSQNETDSIIATEQQTTAVKFQNHFYEALKQKGIENYSRSIDELMVCIGLLPKEAVVYYELGNNFLQLKKYEEAELYLKKALILDDSNFWYKEALYNMYVKQNAYQKAIDALQPLLKAHPDYKQDLANLYLNTARYRDALTIINELDESYGQTPSRLQIRSEIYNLSGREDWRINYLEAQLKASPEDEQNFLNLIYAHSAANNKEQAFETAKTFLAHHLESHLPHVALYKFYLEGKNYIKAIESMKIVTTSMVLEPHLKVKVLNDFVQFVNQHPEFEADLIEVTTHQSMQLDDRSAQEWAQYFYQKKDLKSAIEYYEKALQQNNTSIEIIKNIALLYIEVKQYETAQKFTRQQLEIFPSQPLLYLINGVANIEMSQLEVALESLEMGLDFIVEDNTMLRDFYNQISIIFELQGNSIQSESFSKKAKALDQ